MEVLKMKQETFYKLRVGDIVTIKKVLGDKCNFLGIRNLIEINKGQSFTVVQADTYANDTLSIVLKLMSDRGYADTFYVDGSVLLEKYTKAGDKSEQLS